MSFSPSFSFSQPIGNPSIIIFTDTSSGSDANITTRKIYLRKSDGLYLVPTGTTTDYIEWSYSDSTIEVDVLEKDRALSITVQWDSAANSHITFDNTFDNTFG